MRDRKKILSAVWAVVLIGISVLTVIPLLKLGIYTTPVQMTSITVYRLTAYGRRHIHLAK